MIMQLSRNKNERENAYNETGDFQKMEYPAEAVVTFLRKMFIRCLMRFSVS